MKMILRYLDDRRCADRYLIFTWISCKKWANLCKISKANRRVLCYNETYKEYKMGIGKNKIYERSHE